jgi:hypothetical protein
MKGTFKVGNVDGINWRHCRLTQRIDGYDYSQDCPTGQSPIPLPDESGSIPEV